MLLTELDQFFGFFQCVVFARHTSRIDTVVEHREDFTFQAPGLILREVPVEYVDLILCQFGYLAFQFFHRDIRTAYVLHKSADTESGPVCNGASCDIGSATLFLRQLAERLDSPIHSLFSGCFDGDSLR